ncbi:MULTISPECIES: glyoxalase/bleomycin resistance/extradiol dioxygenase family protein [Streptomycetaceae]|uniref:Glyoxalase/bleomycin resistance protein/dioxygenase n=1 Tax=Streptantibioticus cattleyicolor (strain ATCC 35852 / DSM 46488 / JCM 4925 / NBRC 14057 / NRRL 8057) TaxID=1003195 RepID=F8JVN4_STREN|nr:MULTISPECIES: glyoxalase/bleomycin resistance/extradiol dioxygenase family protein [Streptomycetaceae]AEW96944.1 Glyoxalase/bleomycin resistance protein/dioxygenase [Streptantibioticus cattleyicolor NRRL 8057 = DSM 46488]MYS61416.1 glyoxalase/bleomycin resistance/extradiol dioxygenase family protein [Streptomyces sp. SID5468]CCB77271.1 Glyoxalase/Bleomycin resistance protein/Dioxygenase superfamily [Streptantibioticus cattleyicolor NRRL 8057 = DSM 46488]
MDALHPRLLVRDFDTSLRFWTAALRALHGIEPVKVVPEARYANWDLDGQAVLVIFARENIVRIVGTDSLPEHAAAQDTGMLVLRVADTDDAAARLAAHGATVVAAPQDRPEWGPGLRTAHLRDPEGNLIELQSY